MANKRISALDDISSVGGTSTAEVNANDILPITDVDDTTGSPQGTTKGVKVSDLLANAPDNSTDVTLAIVANNYLSLSGQEITAGIVPVSLGGTGSSDLATARANLGLGTAAITDSVDYATATQGTIADSAVQPAGIANMVETTDGIEALSNVSISNPVNGSILKYVSANSQYEEASLGTASTADSSDFATSAQGALADSALQSLSAGALSDFDFDDNAIKGFSAEVPTEKTADHTLTNDDNGTVVVMNSGSAIKVIVPSGLATGFNCSVIQKGAGQVEFDNRLRSFHHQQQTVPH